MKKMIYLLCFAMLFGLSALPAAAADATTDATAVPAASDDGTTLGQATGGFEFFSGDFNNAKFNEYRVDRHGPFGGFFSADYLSMPTDGTHRYEFDLGYRSLEDIDAHIGVLDYGKYNIDLNYQRFGHEFANDVKTIYNGIGTGNMTLPSTLHNQITTTAAGVANLEDAVAGAHTVDLFLVRDRFNAGFDWMSLGPLTFNADFGYEHREGDRPFGSSFLISGFTINSIETAEPINYDTYNVKAGAEYADKPFYANVSYNHSTFVNNIQSLTLDGLLTSDPVEGRISLPPSNSWDSVSLVLAKNLPLNTRALFDFNYAWFRQDEGLLSPTVNNLANQALNVNPENSPNVAVNTASYDVKITSSPIDKLELTAGYRYYSHDNTTPEGIFFNTDPTDSATITANGAQTEYMSWITRDFNAEASYEIFNKTRLGFDYDHTYENDVNGPSLTESTNSYKIFLDNRSFDWMTARLSYEFSNRDSHMELDTPTTDRPPFAADRDRTLANLLVTFMPMDSVTFSVNGGYIEDRYEDTIFGLNNATGYVGGFDAEYTPAWWLTADVYYTYENDRMRQKEQTTLWSLKTTDETNTVGGSVDVGIVKDLLDLKVDGSYTKTVGDANFTSTTPFINWGPVDQTTLIQVKTELRYKVTKALALSLGYNYEKWNIQDYQYNGLTNVATRATGTYNSLLDMDTLYKPYEVHTAMVMATYKF